MDLEYQLNKLTNKTTVLLEYYKNNKGEDEMNVLSLFDGISCGMIALERANIRVDNYYSSEIEKSAIEISNKNYPDIIRLGDITKIDDEILKTLPKIDLILAGSPCQGFSRNGNMLNFEHKQSKLFFDFIRILDWIKNNNNQDVKFLLENVEMKKEWRDTITSFVKVEPLDINSKLVSAQNRPRVYWTNINNISIPNNRNINLYDILELDGEYDLVSHQGIKIDSSFSEKEKKLISVVNEEVRISQATKQGYIVAENGDGINLSFPTSKTRRGRVVKKKSNTLDKQCNVCVHYDGILRKLQLTELERLQTLPDGYTVDVITHLLKGLS